MSSWGCMPKGFHLFIVEHIKYKTPEQVYKIFIETYLKGNGHASSGLSGGF